MIYLIDAVLHFSFLFKRINVSLYIIKYYIIKKFIIAWYIFRFMAQWHNFYNIILYNIIYLSSFNDTEFFFFFLCFLTKKKTRLNKTLCFGWDLFKMGSVFKWTLCWWHVFIRLDLFKIESVLKMSSMLKMGSVKMGSMCKTSSMFKMSSVGK